MTGQNNSRDDEQNIDLDDIDPAELGFDAVNSGSRFNESGSGIISRIKGTDNWVWYSSWATPSGLNYSVKGFGDITIEPVELDKKFIVEEIQTEAERVAETDDYQELADELNTHADALAEKMIEQWEFDVTEVIGNAMWEGRASVDGTLVWKSNVTEAYSYEPAHALHEVGIEDEYDIADELLREVLMDAVSQHRTSSRNPHADYLARVKFQHEREDS